jgi:hypothetical protein
MNNQKWVLSGVLMGAAFVAVFSGDIAVAVILMVASVGVTI